MNLIDNPLAGLLEPSLNEPPSKRLSESLSRAESESLAESPLKAETQSPFLKNTRRYLTEERLTEHHRSLLDFIEQYWYMNSAYPSVAAIGAWAKQENVNFKDARALEAELAYFLSKRGVIAKSQGGRLTDVQLAAANLVLNFMDRRSPPTKLKSLGVTPTEWQGWLKQPAFADYLKNRTNETLDSNTHEAHLGLLKAVERGDASALKLYYEITGRLNQQEQNPAVSLQLIVSLLIEVIERNVPDPAVKLAISKDVELVMLRSGLLSVNGLPTPPVAPIEQAPVAKENNLLTSALKEIEQAAPVAKEQSFFDL